MRRIKTRHTYCAHHGVNQGHNPAECIVIGREFDQYYDLFQEYLQTRGLGPYATGAVGRGHKSSRPHPSCGRGRSRGGGFGQVPPPTFPPNVPPPPPENAYAYEYGVADCGRSLGEGPYGDVAGGYGFGNTHDDRHYFRQQRETTGNNYYGLSAAAPDAFQSRINGDGYDIPLDSATPQQQQQHHHQQNVAWVPLPQSGGWGCSAAPPASGPPTPPVVSFEIASPPPATADTPLPSPTATAGTPSATAASPRTTTVGTPSAVAASPPVVSFAITSPPPATAGTPLPWPTTTAGTPSATAASPRTTAADTPSPPLSSAASPLWRTQPPPVAAGNSSPLTPRATRMVSERGDKQRAGSWGVEESKSDPPYDTTGGGESGGSYWSLGRPPGGRTRCQQRERHARQGHGPGELGGGAKHRAGSGGVEERKSDPPYDTHHGGGESGGSYWSLGRPPGGRTRCQQQERHARQARVK